MSGLREWGRSRGVEKSEFHDNVTGRSVWRLTAGTFEDKHTYFDICPWSCDGRYIVFSSARRDDVTFPLGYDTLATERGVVSVVNTATWEIREVAHDVLYEMHAGAWCMWHPHRHEVFFRRDRSHVAGLDLETGKERLYPGCVRQISPDGSAFTTFTRPRYDGGAGDALSLMDVESGRVTELVSRETLHALSPDRDEMDVEAVTLSNAKWRPGGQHVMVAMFNWRDRSRRRSLYIVSRDGSEARWLCHFGHHHSWAPEGDRILFCGAVEHPDQAPTAYPKQTVFVVPFEGGESSVAIDYPFKSHPVMSPSGRCIADGDDDGLFAAILDEQRVERLVTFTAQWDGSHKGTQPHAVWNRDGTQLLYNSAERGSSALYLLADLRDL